MTILSMTEILGWRNGEAISEEMHAGYVDLMAQRMGETFGQICRELPPLGEKLTTAASQVSDEGFIRVLIAPETCSHILTQQVPDVRKKGLFFLKSFLAEALREGQSLPEQREIWTALGDFGFASDGSLHEWPQIEEMMPFDFGSPYATKVDLSGADRDSVPQRPPFSEAELQRVIALLRRVRLCLNQTSPRIARFVSRFNKVLVLQKDAEAPEKFASGSNGHYIGRSFLANPHLPQIGEAHMADAIVHEGIHALLYMQEQKEPWFVDPDIKRSFPKVKSPWTGSVISLASFLQACFVWYGLLHFWSLALAARTFDRTMALTRMRLSLRGFLGQALRDHVWEFSPSIDQKVLSAIDEMQAMVAKAFSSVASAL